jgi:hypothetical protein
MWVITLLYVYQQRAQETQHYLPKSHNMIYMGERNSWYLVLIVTLHVLQYSTACSTYVHRYLVRMCVTYVCSLCMYVEPGTSST